MNKTELNKIKKQELLKMLPAKQRDSKMLKADIVNLILARSKSAQKFVKKNEGRKVYKNDVPEEFLRQAFRELFKSGLKLEPAKAREGNKVFEIEGGKKLEVFPTRKLLGKKFSAADRNNLLKLAGEKVRFAEEKAKARVHSAEAVAPDEYSKRGGFDENYFSARLSKAWAGYENVRGSKSPRKVRLGANSPSGVGVKFDLGEKTDALMGDERGGGKSYHKPLLFENSQRVGAPIVRDFMRHLSKLGDADEGLSIPASGQD